MRDLRGSFAPARFLVFTFALGICLFAGWRNAPAQAATYTPPDDAELAALLAKAHSLPEAQALELVSRRFLGAPYHSDPLGEGRGFDPDPRFRLDAFDCQTFLETLLALLRAPTPAAVPALLDTIRYLDGEVSYETRLHFPWLLWVPENERRGFVKNVAAELPGLEGARRESKVMARAEDCHGEKRALCLRLVARFPLGPTAHAFLPLEVVRQGMDKLPSGLFAFVVLKDRPSLPYRISHLGLILRDLRGRLVFRHASRVHGRLLDVPLSGYLTSLARDHQKWPVAGLLLLKPILAH